MDLIDSFKEAIELQQIKQDEQFEVLMNTPLDERIKNGDTLANISVVFDFHDSPPNKWCPVPNTGYKYIAKAHIKCDNNISKYRVGSAILLSNEKMVFEMEVIEDSIENFILAPNDFNVNKCIIEYSDYAKNNWEINITNSNVTKKLLSATANLLSTNNSKYEFIDNFLKGNLVNTKLHLYYNKNLNSSQNDAVSKALGCEYFHLIQGPPGTGKTHTIAYLTKEFAKQNKKILVTGPTHTAINNCINHISKVVDNTYIIKIGENYQSDELKDNKYIYRKRKFPTSDLKDKTFFDNNPIIIGATAYSVCYPASKRLDQWEFDVVIIDEASQLSIPLAIAALSRSKKVILVGDHKQLDPIIPKSTNNPLLSGSIFRLLADTYPKDISLLNTSYRLNEDLIKIPNKLFYNNKLISNKQPNKEFIHFECENHSEIINNPANNVLYLHHEFDTDGKSSFEAEIVTNLIIDLINNKVPSKNIGILSPYRAQVREIKKVLSTIFDQNVIDSIMIDTVDKMQGQQKDYIIYSMSNTYPIKLKRHLDFFYSPNRLNVAITRSVKKCIIIANYKVFNIKDEELIDLPNLDELKPSLDIFKKYVKLATIVEQRKIIDTNW
jgi:superfamily I DNA and/or RNA helicase